MPETISLNCADGTVLSAVLTAAETPKAVVVIGSALGVSQRFYHRFAEFLARQQYSVLTFDYRRTGENAVACATARLADWGQLDIEAAIAYALQCDLPVHFIGHSIGGQLLGLAPSATKLEKIVFVASSAPYWRRWHFPDNWKMLFTSKLVFPLVASMSSEFPSKRFGLGNLNIPSDIFKEWCDWMGREDYLFDAELDLDTSGYAAIRSDMLSFGFSDDSLAPEANLAHLLKFFPNANSSFKMVDPAETGQRAIGHTGLFRDKFQETLWPQILDHFGQR
jgi:predicted alpha/beta hydrolase